MRGAQDRAELREEQLGLGEAEAHRAQPQRRVGRDAREPVEALQLLVGAEVEGADRDRLAVHAFRDDAIGLELLVLRRQALAVEEQELGAEEADARRAVLERLLEVLGQLDVGSELDVDAVERFRGLRAQALQLLPLELELALLQAVFGEHRPIRIDDHHARVAVDDQHLAVADQRPRVVRGDHGRHVEAPRDDGRVRGHAAHVREEGAVVMVLELDHVRRRKVVRDQDRLLLGDRRPQRARLAHEPL